MRHTYLSLQGYEIKLTVANNIYTLWRSLVQKPLFTKPPRDQNCWLNNAFKMTPRNELKDKRIY